MKFITAITEKIKDAHNYGFLWMGRFLIIWGRILKKHQSIMEIAWYDSDRETELWSVYIEIIHVETRIH